MKKNMKIIIALVALLVIAVLAFIILFPADPEELVVEDVRIIEPKETEALDLVSPGNEIVNIEEDIRILDKELDSASEKLFEELNTELNRL